MLSAKTQPVRSDMTGIIIDTFNELGFPCAIMRHTGCGCVRGYVAVPLGHRWYGRQLRDLFPELVRLDFFDEAYSGPSRGEPTDMWWLGFDDRGNADGTVMRLDSTCRFLSRYAASLRGVAVS